jgi:hypothetical protein
MRPAELQPNQLLVMREPGGLCAATDGRRPVPSETQLDVLASEALCRDGKLG